MDKQTKKHIIQCLCAAGRRDLAVTVAKLFKGSTFDAKAGRPRLANAVARLVVARIRKRKGSTRDDQQFPPDIVFETPLAKMYWYGKEHEHEAAGLYVAHDDHEWWWFDIDVNKAERIANQVADVLNDFEQDPDMNLNYEMKRLGAE